MIRSESKRIIFQWLERFSCKIDSALLHQAGLPFDLNRFPDHLDASGVGVEQFATDFHIRTVARAAPELQFPGAGVPPFVLGEVTRQKPALATARAARRNDHHVVPDGFGKRSEIPDHNKQMERMQNDVNLQARVR
ncbi:MULTISPECIES: hypothetical protein [unclassified Rhizobium]|uniref:hypothetical protein n=1 Tax=unclassified Rhizobium TaxID=2613769 RepID=UPI001AEA4E55|nr:MULTISPECIES: hypothetical protein [unclassified Rhizobium]MBP2461429.1 hypothetical protein [Rhizobium sp. PvP014]MBP2528825.1 hypothetical protein [Rhizobium sp. PvP099]